MTVPVTCDAAEARHDEQYGAGEAHQIDQDCAQQHPPAFFQLSPQDHWGYHYDGVWKYIDNDSYVISLSTLFIIFIYLLCDFNYQEITTEMCLTFQRKAYQDQGTLTSIININCNNN